MTGMTALDAPRSRVYDKQWAETDDDDIDLMRLRSRGHIPSRAVGRPRQNQRLEGDGRRGLVRPPTVQAIPRGCTTRIEVGLPLHRPRVILFP